MDFLAMILFFGAIVLFILSIVGAIKKNGKAKKFVLSAVACIVFGVVAIQFTDSGKEGRQKEEAKQEAAHKAEAASQAKKQAAEDKKKAEAKAKKEAVAKKKAEAEATNKAKFDELSKKIVQSSSGVIQAIVVQWETNHWRAKVFVSEKDWIVSTESEKKSFAVSVGNVVKNAVLNSGLAKKDDIIFVDYYSFENRDEIAGEKTFQNGWDIKR